jgi:hypothetical protein
MDNELNKKYYAAMRRFDSHIDLDNGYIKVEIINGEEIGVSEQLFKRFNDVCMQINQDVKDGKYQLSKRDGHIVIIENVKAIYPRLKDSNENNEWTPVNLNQPNVGMALMDAMRHYWRNRSSIGTIDKLINMSTGNFSMSQQQRSGTITYGGYTYTWNVNGVCQANNWPDDCIWSNIQTDYRYDYGSTGCVVKLVPKDGGYIFSIRSSQSGSYGPLSNYIFN